MGEDFPHLRAALAGPVLEVVIGTWQALAAEHADTGAYLAETSWEKMVPYGGDPLSVAVANTAPHAAVLEDGHGGMHLPSVIDWGRAVAKGTAHLSARGVPYLRIPFRHYTGGHASGGMSRARARAVVPAAVVRAAKDLITADREQRARLRETIRAAGRRLSRPYEVMQGTPRRGLTLRDLSLQSLLQAGQPGYTWRASLFEGMRVRTQVNPETGRTSSTYHTFRTLAADSLGWWVPPFGGYHFAARTVDAVLPQVHELLGEAARDDVVALVNAAIAGRA